MVENYKIRWLCEYVNRRNSSELGFKKSILDMYRRNSIWAMILYVPVVFLGFFYRPPSASIKYFFWGNRFHDIILGLPANEVCIVGGPKQLIFCIRHRIAFFPCLKMWGELYDLIRCQDFLGQRKLINSMGKVAKDIDCYASNSSWVVVDNDSMPAQRAFISAVRHVERMSVVCVQDGIFQSKSPAHIFHGYSSDLFFAINNDQKNMLASNGVNNIQVMGLHSKTFIPKREISLKEARRVCILGQPWCKYGEVRGQKYLNIVKSIMSSLSRMNVTFTYKPHPWEHDELYVKSYPNVFNEGLFSAFEEYDVFISISSTALLEAERAGRIAVQIIEDGFDQDDFTVHGDISVIHFDNGVGIDEKLASCISSDVVEHAVDAAPSVRFLEALTRAR